MSLRKLLALVVVGLALLASGASLTLFALLSFQHRAAETLGGVVESMRIAEELEVELLRHEHTVPGGFGRLDVETHLREGFARAEASATTESAPILAESRRRVDAYLATADRTGAGDLDVEATLLDAFQALDAFVDVSYAQAQAETARAESSARFATLLGLATAATLLLGSVGLMAWLKWYIVRPTLQLSHSIRRYGAGDRGSRPAVQGPTEIREAAAAFETLAAALENEERLRLALVGGVAHDLRTPLTVLKLSLERLAAAPVGDPQAPAELARANAQVDRLSHMAEDVLDAARMASGGILLRKAPVDLSALARDVVASARAASPAHALSIEAPAEPLTVTCDPARMQQVLENLVSNAVKYSPRGGRVRVELARDAARARLSVADEGIGIVAEERAAAFEPFRRLGAGRDVAPGAGVGLFMAKRIVDAHGGSIEVAGAEGLGTTIRVSLPIGQAPA